MLILLIVLAVIAVNDCHSCEPSDPPPYVSPPAPDCAYGTYCATSCGDSPYFACSGCAPGEIDYYTSCLGYDGGPPSWTDGAPPSCDSSAECARASECVYSCEDEEPFYVGCCACPPGSLDRAVDCGGAETDGGLPDGDAPDAEPPPDDGGPPGLLPIGAGCADDRQCESGLCYGSVLASGAFDSPTCAAACLAPSDYGHYCLNDRHCCGLRCCIGCGEREGLCVGE